MNPLAKLNQWHFDSKAALLAEYHERKKTIQSRCSHQFTELTDPYGTILYCPLCGEERHEEATKTKDN